MCGGYTVNTNAPQRYLNDLKDQESILMPEITEDNSVECCKIFGSRVNYHNHNGVGFLYHKQFRYFGTERKYALAGAKNPRIANRFRLVYHITSTKGPAVSGGRANILYTKCTSMYLNFIVIFYFCWIRPLFQTEPTKKTV